jgi:hypothetical protein
MTASSDRQTLDQRLLAAGLLWNACDDGNLEAVQALVNNTPQDQRAVLLGRRHVSPFE